MKLYISLVLLLFFLYIVVITRAEEQHVQQKFTLDCTAVNEEVQSRITDIRFALTEIKNVFLGNTGCFTKKNQLKVFTDISVIGLFQMFIPSLGAKELPDIDVVNDKLACLNAIATFLSRRRVVANALREIIRRFEDNPECFPLKKRKRILKQILGLAKHILPERQINFFQKSHLKKPSPPHKEGHKPVHKKTSWKKKRSHRKGHPYHRRGRHPYYRRPSRYAHKRRYRRRHPKKIKIRVRAY